MHCASLDLTALGLENSLLSGSLAFWDVVSSLVLQIKNIQVCVAVEFIQTTVPSLLLVKQYSFSLC